MTTDEPGLSAAIDAETLTEAIIEVGNRDERVGGIITNPHLLAQNIAAIYSRLAASRLPPPAIVGDDRRGH